MNEMEVQFGIFDILVKCLLVIKTLLLESELG